MTSVLLTLPVVVSLGIAVLAFFLRRKARAVEWVSVGGAIVLFGVAGLLLSDISALGHKLLPLGNGWLPLA
ncbi:hypothetical protein JCM19236_2160 [Vibrio sp. JCM 19236]|nr:hypothetical protein JCM19236_2160 [Vibrio sp. JCM 19236]